MDTFVPDFAGLPGAAGGRREVDSDVSWEHIPGMIERGGQILVLGTSSRFEESGDLGRNLERLYRLIGRS